MHKKTKNSKMRRLELRTQSDLDIFHTFANTNKHLIKRLMKEKLIILFYVVILLSTSLSAQAEDIITTESYNKEKSATTTTRSTNKRIASITHHISPQNKSLEEDEQSQIELLLKDSIWKAYQSMPNDTLRIMALQRVFRQYIGKKWSIELLDTILPEAQKLNYTDGELRARYAYCNYYSYNSDTLNMRISFESLREASFKHNMYYYYFRMWNYLLEYKSVRGESESVILEADAMKQKASELKEEKGVYYANLAKASALKAARREKEAIELYSEMIKDSSLNKNEKSDIHWFISRLQLDLKKYEEAINEMNLSQQLLNKYYQEHGITPNRDKLLEKEIGFCKVYAATADKSKLYHHLKRANRYYTHHTHPSLKIGYHLLWANYYQFMEQWEKCFDTYDIALSLFDGTMPLYENSIRLLKAKALVEARRYKESAEIYRYAAEINDSMNKNIAYLHAEALQANYIINQALLDKSRIERKYTITSILLFALLCLLFIAILSRIVSINKQLRKRKKETKSLLERARKRNLEKEEFLHSITHQIRNPLNSVVGLSTILSNKEEVTKEEKELSENCIKEDAAILSNLIFDVLYLSRLESGMMRLKIEPSNIVELCNKAAEIVQIRKSTSTPIILQCTEDEIIADTDQENFIKIVTSILLKMADKSEMIAFKLAYRAVDTFEVTIKARLFLGDESEENFLQQNIHRAFIKLFGGEYNKIERPNETIIQFVLPCHFAISAIE